MAGQTERPVWKDQTSFSKSDKERVPSVWVMKLTRNIKISVVRGHICDPENWVMHCDPWFMTTSLNLPSTVENLDEAKARAITLVRDKVTELDAVMRGLN